MTNDKVPQKPLVSQFADGIRNSPYLKVLKFIHDLDIKKGEQELVKGILEPQPQPNLPDLDPDYFERQAKYIEKDRREQAEYNQAILTTLKNIEKNTDTFTTEIVSLLQDSNEKQDEILKVVMEIVQIGKSNSQEEAESKWKAVVNNINTVTDSVSTIQTLYGMANSAYKAFQSLNL